MPVSSWFESLMRDDVPPLTPQMLLHAYQAGIFPMSEGREESEIFWVDPRKRGIIPLDGFHISRSLAKSLRTCGWQVTRNTAFDQVVEACADRPETWISHDIARLYSALHDQGHAHSLELWESGSLIGGVYGVTTGTAYFGESMFSRRTNASKTALAYLVTHLRNQGFTLFDTQFLTHHLSTLGGIEIDRQAYHARLQAALENEADFRSGALPDVQDVMHLRTQTS